MEFVGIGGPKMAAAGCELIESTVGRAVMTYTALAHLGHFYKLVRRVRRYLQEHPVDLVIVCDSPAFNFHVAKAAKTAGIKTLFYVAPQLWAWAEWRIHKLRRCCDKLCCLLPFEEPWFRRRGVDTTFVGNPLLDKLPRDLTGLRKDYSHFDPRKAKIALMPGSRLAEIQSLWRPMQEIAVELKRRYVDASFTAVAVSAERRQLLEQTQIPGFTCDTPWTRSARPRRRWTFPSWPAAAPRWKWPPPAARWWSCTRRTASCGSLADGGWYTRSSLPW